jgi:dihydrofolate reductase
VSKLIYSSIASLDGYIEDEDGNFEWAMPDEEVLSFVNQLERTIGTYLYGRRMYETMTFWETAPTDTGQSPLMRDFAELWRAADKVVYSTTLEKPKSERTRIESTFDPVSVREMKSEATRDISVGGPGLAAQALRAGLVDEFRLFVIGGGKPSLPGNLQAKLDLLEDRHFGNGAVYLRYGIIV